MKYTTPHREPPGKTPPPQKPRRKRSDGTRYGNKLIPTRTYTAAVALYAPPQTKPDLEIEKPEAAQ